MNLFSVRKVSILIFDKTSVSNVILGAVSAKAPILINARKFTYTTSVYCTFWIVMKCYRSCADGYYKDAGSCQEKCPDNFYPDTKSKSLTISNCHQHHGNWWQRSYLIFSKYLPEMCRWVWNMFRSKQESMPHLSSERWSFKVER